MKILIIDDDYQIVQSLSRFMTRMGYHCDSVTNPEVALQEFSKGKYDIIITDFKMPEMDGNEFLEQVKMIDSDCHVIIITGFASLDDAIVSINLGAYAFLQKPFELNELLKIMKRIEEQIKAKTDFDLEKQNILQQISSIQKFKSISMKTAGLVHDLNNILLPIIYNSQEEDISENKSFNDFLSLTIESKDKTNTIVKNIFCLTEYLKSSPEQNNISNILDNALKITETFLPNNIKIIRNYDSKTAISFNHPLDIISIVVNLTNNAIDALENLKDGAIEIALKELDKSEINLEDLNKIDHNKIFKLSVSDNGKGIDEQHLSYVFEPYYTTREIGKGFGLHEVKNLVMKHGGDIKVISNNERGTTFTIYLPCV